MCIRDSYWIAIHARDRFGALLVVGITTLTAVQVFLNISVVTNLIPTTGISLPFFSYGGTALPCNIVGAAWASNINFGLAAALNIFFLIRSGITFKVYALGKILLAAVLMAAVSMLLYNYLIVYWGNTFATAVTIFAAGIVYLLTLIASGTIGRKELQKLPVIGSRFK